MESIYQESHRGYSVPCDAWKDHTPRPTPWLRSVVSGRHPQARSRSRGSRARVPRACPPVNLPNSTGRSRWGEGVTAEDMQSLRWVKPAVVVEVAFTEWSQK